MPRPVALLLASALLAPPALADSAQSQSNGFVEDGRWSLLNRSVFDQRDYKHGGRNSAGRNAYKPRDERSGKAEEWAYGLMGTFRSGFTQGLIGVGSTPTPTWACNSTAAAGAWARHACSGWITRGTRRTNTAVPAQH